MPTPAPAPAYYATGTTGWRAAWTLLHPPYTLLHLSFVAVGAGLAPSVDWVRLGWTLLAFLLAMGIGAHALDELNGRPLNTRVPKGALVAAATVALLAAAGIGLWGARHYDLAWGVAFVPIGVFLVLAYNLEWWSGRIHTDLGFAAAWGAFPALVGYFAQTGRLDPLAVLGASYALALSITQRRLSTPARRLRRQVATVEGRLELVDGTAHPLDREALLRPTEGALRALVWSGVLVAALLLARHAA